VPATLATIQSNRAKIYEGTFNSFQNAKSLAVHAIESFDLRVLRSATERRALQDEVHGRSQGMRSEPETNALAEQYLRLAMDDLVPSKGLSEPISSSYAHFVWA
jgi:hypothetical protein